MTVVFDHRVGEQLFAHVGERRIIGAVGHIEFDQPADTHIFDPGKAEPFERMVDGATLRIENAGLERDMDADLHRAGLSCWRAYGAPSPSVQAPRNDRMVMALGVTYPRRL